MDGPDVRLESFLRRMRDLSIELGIVLTEVDGGIIVYDTAGRKVVGRGWHAWSATKPPNPLISYTPESSILDSTWQA